MSKTHLTACLAVASACAAGPTPDAASHVTPVASHEPQAAAPTQVASTDRAASPLPEATSAATTGAAAQPPRTPTIATSSVSTAATSAKPPDCGFVPAPSASFSSDRAARPWNAGCGLAADPQASVVTLNVVEVDLSADPTVVRFVLLDAAKRRVVPTTVPIWYDLVLVPRATGLRRLGATHQRDGVFELKMPGRRRIGSPCNWWVRLRYEPGTGPTLQDEMDDWLHDC